MADEGYILLARKFFDNPYWTTRRVFSTAEAWIDLIAWASFRDRKVMVGVDTVELGRGEFLASVRFLMKRWRWSRTRVHRFLRACEARSEIETRSGTANGTIYRVVKYDAYQKPWDSAPGQQQGQTRDSNGTPAGQRRIKVKKENEGNKKYSAEFEEFWVVYPGRVPSSSKPDAWRCWNARLAEGYTAADMIAAAKRYAAYCFAEGMLRSKYVKMASTFLGPGEHIKNEWAVSSPKTQPGSEAASVESEIPQQSGPRTPGLATTGGQRLETQEEIDDKRITAWKRDHADLAGILWTECVEEVRDLPGARMFGTFTAQKMVESKFRQRVLNEQLKPKAVA